MEILILLFLIILNGIFAMSEMAVVSARKPRLQQWADEGRPGAAAALALTTAPSHFLSTIQVGITVIGITSGAFGEATLARDLALWLQQWSLLVDNAEGISLAMVVATITVASLLIGELVPKRLALVSPERIASIIAKPMAAFTWLIYPVVRVLSSVTENTLRVLAIKPSTDPAVTEEEIEVLLEQGAEAGVFEPHEPKLISRVFRLDDMRATAVMTPRPDVVYIDLNAPSDQTLAAAIESRHSHFPVLRGGWENVAGVLHIKNLVEDAVRGNPLSLESRLEQPFYVPGTLSVMEVMEAFRKNRQTFGFVVNEYGDVDGIMTLHDVLEALVGDIPTVEDQQDSDAVQRPDGSWLLDGGISIDRLKEVLAIEAALPDEESGAYHTLAGFVMAALQRVPKTGESFDWGGYKFEVADMDRNRVDKMLVSRPAQCDNSTGS
jgi:putative hemolysin